jgi:hypothetical protein
VPFDLTNFGLAEMLQLGRGLRLASAGTTSMRAAAETTTRYLYRECIDPGTGTPACALVRLYKTHAFGELPPDEQAFARGLLGTSSAPAKMKCLTMLASSGDEPGWNSPSDSRGHRAIPLPSVQMVESAPMIAALIKQFGLTIESVVSPPKMADSLVGKTYNVFHVADARGSSAIPAQDDFVIPHGIRSALGFGGVLRTGDLFAVIMFTKTPISDDAASRFRNIALEVKTLLFNFGETEVFG